MNRRHRLAFAALLAGALAAPLLAAAESTPSPNPPPCMGAGPCGGGGGWQAGPRNTPGYTLMTPEERTAHVAKMRSLKTMEECETYLTEHRAAMAKRAQEQGKAMPRMRRDPCAMLKQQGAIK